MGLKGVLKWKKVGNTVTLITGLPDRESSPGPTPPPLTEERVQQVEWCKDPDTCSSALQPLSQCSVYDLWHQLEESEEKTKMRNFWGPRKICMDTETR